MTFPLLSVVIFTFFSQLLPQPRNYLHNLHKKYCALVTGAHQIYCKKLHFCREKNTIVPTQNIGDLPKRLCYKMRVACFYITIIRMTILRCAVIVTSLVALFADLSQGSADLSQGSKEYTPLCVPEFFVFSELVEDAELSLGLFSKLPAKDAPMYVSQLEIQALELYKRYEPSLKNNRDEAGQRWNTKKTEGRASLAEFEIMSAERSFKR
jgi:hypothetical protein